MPGGEHNDTNDAVSKVAQITGVFWVLKILATTLGETSGDLIAITIGLGYVVGIAITLVFLATALSAQIRAAEFHRPLFWTAIVATTMTGTEISDFLDRSVGLGYSGGAALLAVVLVGVLVVWQRLGGGIRIYPIRARRTELFYWAAVLASNSLGTALGDFLSDRIGLGYIAATLVTIALIIGVLALDRLRINRTAVFWMAFVLTRPFGATFGDFLTKPVAHGGLNLGTAAASATAFVAMAAIILIYTRIHGPQAGRPQRP